MNKNFEFLEAHSKEIVSTADSIWNGDREVLSSGWPKWSVALHFEHENKDYSLYFKNIWAFTPEHAYKRALGKTVISMVEGRIH